jgi:hypothetical protein
MMLALLRLITVSGGTVTLDGVNCARVPLKR